MQDHKETEDISFKSKAITGILWGGFSNGAQQVLGLIFGLYLARQLTEKDYGLIGLLTVFSLLASSIQESGFINALANKKDITKRDYNAVFWFNILLSLLLYALLYFIAPYISLYFKTPELTVLSRVLFLGFVIGSFGIVHSAYLFRNLKVKERALATTLSVLFAGIIATIMVHFKYAYWSLVAQTLTYNLCYTSICFYFSNFRPTLQIDFQPIHQLWKFSSKILTSNLISHLNNNILTLYLGRFFSKESVGVYTQASKWSNMPQGIISNMSHGFAQPLLAKLENDTNQQNTVFLKLLRFISFMTFPTLALLCIVSREFILITITEKWSKAIPFLQILCINAAFLPLINYYSNYFLSKGASQVYMFHNILYGIIQLAILLFMRNQEIIHTVYVISAFTCLWSFIWQISVSKYSKIPYLVISKIIFANILPSILIAIITYYLSAYITQNIYYSFIIKSISFVTLYILTQHIMKSIILKEIVTLLKSRLS